MDQSRRNKNEKKGVGDSENVVFALDIGTRSVVGITGVTTDDSFSVFDYEQRLHKNRAMRDGQIEDINLVAKTVREIKKALEERNGMDLSKVSIAAAGRSLKTLRMTYEQDINEEENITPELMHSIEYNAISAALDDFARGDDSKGAFSCVGYDVVNYRLDGYLLNNPLGHRGGHIVVEIIAAFLPFSVIRSLYSVTELCNLTVESLTLEPIAAINAVVPPDVRLLNIAITDIGAGTSDIGISKNGSIVAYDMVTIAGDEITECLMKHYLVDFDTGEKIKFKLSEDDEQITFADILGVSHSCSRDAVSGVIDQVLEELCDSVSSSILKINDGPPTALFLVGGASQIPGLCAKMAGKLNIPVERVTLGGKYPYRNIILHTDKLLTPEYATPLGIGATSRLTHIHDLFSVTVNGEKITMPGSENVRVLDALLLAGVKASSLIGRSAAPVTYYINDEEKTMRGTPPVPGQILVNKEPAALDSPLKQGDEVAILFAQHGKPPQLTVSDIRKNLGDKVVLSVAVNGKSAKSNYRIKQGDRLAVAFGAGRPEEPPEAPEPPEAAAASLSIGEIDLEEVDGEATDDIVVKTDTFEYIEIKRDPNETASEATPKKPPRAIRISINDNWTVITADADDPPLFLDMLNYVSIDTKKAKGDLVLSLNGNPASYTDPVHDGDLVQIKWSE